MVTKSLEKVIGGGVDGQYYRRFGKPSKPGEELVFEIIKDAAREIWSKEKREDDPRIWSTDKDGILEEYKHKIYFLGIGHSINEVKLIQSGIHSGYNSLGIILPNPKEKEGVMHYVSNQNLGNWVQIIDDDRLDYIPKKIVSLAESYAVIVGLDLDDFLFRKPTNAQNRAIRTVIETIKEQCGFHESAVGFISNFRKHFPTEFQGLELGVALSLKCVLEYLRENGYEVGHEVRIDQSFIQRIRSDYIGKEEDLVTDIQQDERLLLSTETKDKFLKYDGWIKVYSQMLRDAELLQTLASIRTGEVYFFKKRVNLVETLRELQEKNIFIKAVTSKTEGVLKGIWEEPIRVRDSSKDILLARGYNHISNINGRQVYEKILESGVRAVIWLDGEKTFGYKKVEKGLGFGEISVEDLERHERERTGLGLLYNLNIHTRLSGDYRRKIADIKELIGFIVYKSGLDGVLLTGRNYNNLQLVTKARVYMNMNFDLDSSKILVGGAEFRMKSDKDQEVDILVVVDSDEAFKMLGGYINSIGDANIDKMELYNFLSSLREYDADIFNKNIAVIDSHPFHYFGLANKDYLKSGRKDSYLEGHDYLNKLVKDGLVHALAIHELAGDIEGGYGLKPIDVERLKGVELNGNKKTQELANKLRIPCIVVSGYPDLTSELTTAIATEPGIPLVNSIKEGRFETIIGRKRTIEEYKEFIER